MATTLDPPAVNGAGIVLVCTPVGGHRRYLLLRNQWGDKCWSFPKGHADKADKGAHLKTALRETLEETGIGAEVIAILDGPVPNSPELGRVVYAMPRPTKKVPTGIKHYVFFLGEVAPHPQSNRPPVVSLSKEHLEVKWCSFGEAAAILPPRLLHLLNLTR